MAIKITFSIEDAASAAKLLTLIGKEYDMSMPADVGEEKKAEPKPSDKAKKAAIEKKSRKTKSSKTEETTEVQDVDLDDLRTALLTLGSTHNLGLCTDALARVGVKKLSDVNESKYKELHTILLEAIETGEA